MDLPRDDVFSRSGFPIKQDGGVRHAHLPHLRDERFQPFADDGGFARVFLERHGVEFGVLPMDFLLQHVVEAQCGPHFRREQPRQFPEFAFFELRQ